MVQPCNDIQHLMFTVHGRVMTQFVQQLKQITREIVVEVLNGSLEILATNHLIHVFHNHLIEVIIGSVINHHHHHHHLTSPSSSSLSIIIINHHHHHRHHHHRQHHHHHHPHHKQSTTTSTNTTIKITLIHTNTSINNQLSHHPYSSYLQTL